MTEILRPRTASGRDVWLDQLLFTDGGVAALILRLTLAFVIFPHGAQNQQGEGFEYHLLVLGIAAAVVFWGSGALSLDRALAVRRLDRSLSAIT